MEEEQDKELGALILIATNSLLAVSKRLADGEIEPSEWKNRSRSILLRLYTEVLKETLEFDISSPNPEDVSHVTYVMGLLADQYAYLENFEKEIEEDGWKDAYFSRIAMYALSAKVPYHYGKIENQYGSIPLPAYPAQGTQCLTRCGCSWRIAPIDSEKGDFDCYWMLGKSDNCQTCTERAANWSPFSVRGWLGV